MPRRYSYPENLLSAMHLNEETQRMISYDALTDDQRKGLEYALSALSEREQIVLREHFCEGIGYRAVGLHYNLSESRTRSIIRDALCWLCKNPTWLYYITDGFEARTAYLRQQLQMEEQIYRERRGITSPTHLYYQGLEALHLPAKLHNPLSRNGVKTGREVNVTKLSQNTPLHSKLSCNGALFCVFSKKHLTNMQFRAAILLSTLSKMALVVRSVSRHKNYKEDYL